MGPKWILDIYFLDQFRSKGDKMPQIFTVIEMQKKRKIERLDLVYLSVKKD